MNTLVNPHRINIKKTMCRHTIVKFLTNKNTEKTFKVDRKKHTHYIHKNNNSNMADLETMNVSTCGNTSCK